MECVICLRLLHPREQNSSQHQTANKFLHQLKTKHLKKLSVQELVQRLSYSPGSANLCGDCSWCITRAMDWKEQIDNLKKMMKKMNESFREEICRLRDKCTDADGAALQGEKESAPEDIGFVQIQALEECEAVPIVETAVIGEVEEVTDLDIEPMIYVVNSVPGESIPQVKETNPVASVSSASNSRSKTRTKRKPNSRHVCPYCGRSFAKNPRNLADHINIHTGARPYQCPECPLAFTAKGHLISHKREKHTGFNCLQCGLKFVWKKTLENHQTLHEKYGETFKCNVCEMKFPSSSTRTKHMLQEHEPSRKAPVNVPKRKRKFSCSKRRFGPCYYCGQKFKSEFAFKYHLNTHTGGNHFQCDLCPKSYFTRYMLGLHKKSHFRNKSSSNNCAIPKSEN